MIEYRMLHVNEINRELFRYFRRRQVVTKCWRKVNGVWCIKDIAFTDEWTEKDYVFLVSCLKNTVQTGGMVSGAFLRNQLKGFVSVEAALFGGKKEYLDLSSIHVSEEMRGRGVGRELFRIAKNWAKQHGAKKLYISAHSAVESQAFYRAMGCVEALEYNQGHVAREPSDCQLECMV